MSTLPSKLLILSFLLVALYPPLSFFEREKFKHSSYTDVAIGNSHARAFNFSAMGVSGINLYKSGSDIRSALGTLEQVISNLESVERIWIPIAPAYLYRDKTHNLIKRQNLFDPHKLSNFMDAVRPRPRRWSDVRNYIRSAIVPSFSSGIFEGVKISYQIVDPDLIKPLADETVLRHLEHTSFKNNSNIEYLERILEISRAAKASVILITPPYTEEYFHHEYMRKYEKVFRVDLEEILLKHDNAMYFDLHDIFFEHLEFFVDDDHLNFQGASKFSEMLTQFYPEIFK